jgi:hypothetical protein
MTAAVATDGDRLIPATSEASVHMRIPFPLTIVNATACYLGCLTAALLFLYGLADLLDSDAGRGGNTARTHGTDIYAETVRDQRDQFARTAWALSGKLADADVRCAKVAAEVSEWRERATVAEARLAHAEERLTTLAVLAEARERVGRVVGGGDASSTNPSVVPMIVEPRPRLPPITPPMPPPLPDGWWRDVDEDDGERIPAPVVPFPIPTRPASTGGLAP